MIKYLIKFLIRQILKILYILPIKKNLIYFESFNGKQISCNPYYIFKELQKRELRYIFIWCYNGGIDSIKNVKFVKFKTFKRIIAIMTSKVIISNDGFSSYIPYRKQQILINTWHGGGAYKLVGKESNSREQNNKNNFLSTKFVSERISYFISSSKVFSNIMTKTMMIGENKFLNIGMPRNDIFFNQDAVNKINLKTRRYLGIENEKILILYAPTYRDKFVNENFNIQIDILKIKHVVEKKFNKIAVFLIRGHHAINQLLLDNSFDYDVSDYGDMQELLCAVDILITDYSSSMWDFSLTKKPCFLFTPDIDEYIKDRGFCTDPYSWGFTLAKTNDDLCKNILNFNQIDYDKSMKQHHLNLGSYETGEATNKMCNIIDNEIIKNV